MAELGYVDIRTILNSGNVVFSGTQHQPSSTGKRMEEAMAQRLGVSGRVTVLTAAEFFRVVEENALGKVATDPARLLVAFCSDRARLKELGGLKRRDWTPEAMVAGSLAAYLWCAGGILASRLLEAVGGALGESTTTRNWSTVSKIHEALQAESGVTARKAARRLTRGG